MKKQFSIILGFGLSALFLAIVLRQMDFAKVAAAYKNVSFWHVAAIAILTCFDFLFRGLKWKLLLQPSKNTPLFGTIKLEAIGMALNNVLPFRMGELARSFLCAGKYEIPLMTVFSTVVVERLIDLLSLSVIFIIGANMMPADSAIGEFRHLAWLIAFAITASVTVFIFADEIIAKFPKLKTLLEKYPKINKLVSETIVGGRTFKSPKNAALALVYGVALWMINGCSYFVAGFAFNFTPVLSYAKSLVTVCTTALTAAIPSMPGYFGTFELAVQKLLGAWGYDKDLSLAYATFVHINIYLVMTALGLIFLYQAGSSLSDVWKRFSKNGGDKNDA